MESNYKKRILFVGMPDMAIIAFRELIEKGFNIVGIVPPLMSDPTFGTMKQLAQYYNLPFFPYKKMNDPKFIKEIKKFKADIGVVCSFNKRIPKEFLETTRDGFLNCHPSLLPYYRGGNPYSAVIINNEKFSGVTIHFMDENFDTGDMVFQSRVEIEPNETMGTLFNKLNYTCASALAAVLDRYETSALPRQAQPEGEFVKAPNYQSGSYPTFINWADDGEFIERKVRALNPFIYATTTFRHIGIKIHNCEFEKKYINFAPGVVVDMTKGFGVSCKNGIIHIKSLQFGTFISSEGADFVRRFSPKIGEKVG